MSLRSEKRDGHFSEDAHGRWMNTERTLGGLWFDAKPTFEDAGKNWSRDGHVDALES